MIELTNKDNKGIGEGECRFSYLLQHENFSTAELSMQKDEKGNLVSPQFSGKLFLPTKLLTERGDTQESVVFVLARILILDYLSKNGLEWHKIDSDILGKFPHSGHLQFIVPADKPGNLVCRYSPSVADQSYVEKCKSLKTPKIAVSKLAIAYTIQPSKVSAEKYEANQGSGFNLSAKK